MGVEEEERRRGRIEKALLALGIKETGDGSLRFILSAEESLDTEALTTVAFPLRLLKDALENARTRMNQAINYKIEEITDIFYER